MPSVFLWLIFYPTPSAVMRPKRLPSASGTSETFSPHRNNPKAKKGRTSVRPYLMWRRPISLYPANCATIPGFSSVEMSCVISLPLAMERSRRRMIFAAAGRRETFGGASAVGYAFRLCGRGCDSGGRRCWGWRPDSVEGASAVTRPAADRYG